MEAHYNGERSRLSANAYQGGFELENLYFNLELSFVDFQSIYIIIFYK